MSIDPSSTSLAISVGSEVHKILKEKKIYDKVADWLFGDSETTILILGATGVGKTSFVKSLKNEYAFIPRNERTVEGQTFTGKIDKLTFKLIDTPGQISNKEFRRSRMDEAAESENFGIVNVVCNGYHETASYNFSQAIKNGLPDTTYLEERRKSEVLALSEWTHNFSPVIGHKRARWVITLITKADIWWHPIEKESVLEHYLEGEYEQSLGAVRHLPHYVAPYSSVRDLFYDHTPMSGYYTDMLRIGHYNNLIATILDLSSNYLKSS